MTSPDRFTSVTRSPTVSRRQRPSPKESLPLTVIGAMDSRSASPSLGRPRTVWNGCSRRIVGRCALSISSRKWRIRPCTGHAAASPSAQIVWPSTCPVTSSSMSISRFCARPSATRSSTRHIQPVPSRHGVHWPQLSVLVEIRDPGDGPDHVGRLVHHDHRRRAEAGREARHSVSKSMKVVGESARRHHAARTTRPGSPPADCPSRRVRRRNAPR